MLSVGCFTSRGICGLLRCANCCHSCAATSQQVLILLETEEIVEQPWRRQVKAAACCCAGCDANAVGPNMLCISGCCPIYSSSFVSLHRAPTTCTASTPPHLCGQVAGGGSVIRRVHDEHLELTGDTGCTHFLFTIPPDAPPSFQTPLMQLRWLLRFQFTAALPPSGKGVADWSPLQGKLEQLTWALPVTVLPPSA